MRKKIVVKKVSLDETSKRIIRALPLVDKLKVLAHIARENGRTKAIEKAALRAIELELKRHRVDDALQLAEKFGLNDMVREIVLRMATDSNDFYIGRAVLTAKKYGFDDILEQIKIRGKKELLDSFIPHYICDSVGGQYFANEVVHAIYKFDLLPQLDSIVKDIFQICIRKKRTSYAVDLFTRSGRDFIKYLSKDTLTDLFYMLLNVDIRPAEEFAKVVPGLQAELEVLNGLKAKS